VRINTIKRAIKNPPSNSAPHIRHRIARRMVRCLVGLAKIKSLI
jgi:hypothetical protein